MAYKFVVPRAFVIYLECAFQPIFACSRQERGSKFKVGYTLPKYFYTFIPLRSLQGVQKRISSGISKNFVIDLIFHLSVILMEDGMRSLYQITRRSRN